MMETKVGCAPIEGGRVACVKAWSPSSLTMRVFTKGGAREKSTTPGDHIIVSGKNSYRKEELREKIVTQKKKSHESGITRGCLAPRAGFEPATRSRIARVSHG